MFFKIIFPVLIVLFYFSSLSSTVHLPHSEEEYRPYNFLTNIPSRRSGINLLNSIPHNNFSIPKSEIFKPYFTQDLYCKYKANNKIQFCQHGTYTNECGFEDCYHGVGESCDGNHVSFPVHGKCHPTLYCLCGECTGCQNEYCRLELCKKNGYYEKKQANFIGSDYYYR